MNRNLSLCITILFFLITSALVRGQGGITLNIYGPDDTPDRTCLNQLITYSVSGYGGCVPTVTKWTFDAGTEIIGNNQVASVKYSTSGFHQVTINYSGPNCGVKLSDSGAGKYSTAIWIDNSNLFTPSVTLSADNTVVCQGTPIKLTASPNMSSFSYSIDNVTAPNQTGSNQYNLATANITGNNHTASVTMGPVKGCVTSQYATASVNFNVIPLPKITTPAEQLQRTICNNSQLSFTPTSSVSGTYYSWTATLASGQVSGFNSNSSSNSGLINDVLKNNGNTVGTVNYAITPHLGSCVGPVSNYAIAVNPDPSVSLKLTDPNGTGVICSGANYTFTYSATGSISWTIPNINGASAPVSSPVQQMLYNTGNTPLSGSYQALPYFSSSAGNCYGSPASIPATVNPIPSGSANNLVLFSGQTMNMQLNSSLTAPYDSYTLFSLSAQKSNVVQTIPAQTYSPYLQQLSLIDANNSGWVNYSFTPSYAGCLGNAFNATVYVFPKPVVNFSSRRIVMGPVSLNTQSIYDSYDWKLNSAHISDKNGTNSLTANTVGNYTVTVTKSVSGISGTATSDPVAIQGQFDGQNRNYIVTNNMMTGDVTDPSAISLLPITTNNQTVEYFDGLGRSVQKVGTQSSPQKNDFVQPVLYDDFGREAFRPLPVSVDNTGLYKENIINQNGLYKGTAGSFYGSATNIASDEAPFTQTVFESSPLNRPLKDYGPGKIWRPSIEGGSDKFITHQYLINQQDEVILFSYDPSSGLVSSGVTSLIYQAAGNLKVKVTTDEQGNEVREYTDKLGHVVCKKVQYKVDGNGVKQYTSTYYLYDDLGNLVVVLPPEAVKKILSQMNQDN
jgi:hypothetical protein